MAENDIYRVRTPRNRTYLGNRDSHAYFTNELAYSNFLCKELFKIIYIMKKKIQIINQLILMIQIIMKDNN